MFEVFSTREIAMIIIVASIFLIAFSFKSMRKIIADFLKILFCKFYLKQFLKSILYLVMIILIFSRFSIWDWKYLKDITVWYIFSGLILYIKSKKLKQDLSFFKNIILDNLKIIVLIEFLVNNFTFPLVVEIIIQIILYFLILLYSVWKEDKRLIQLNKFIECIILVYSILLIFFTVKVAIENYEEIILQDFIITLILPFILSVLFFPLIYFSSLSIRYKEIFSRMHIRTTKNEKEFKKQKKLIYKKCNISYKKLIQLDSFYTTYIRNIKYGKDGIDINEYIENLKF